MCNLTGKRLHGLPWSWVRMAELISATKISAQWEGEFALDLLKRFGALANDGGLSIVLTLGRFHGEVIPEGVRNVFLKEEHKGIFAQDILSRDLYNGVEMYFTYVPKGFALSVMAAVERGCHHVIEIDLGPVVDEAGQEPIPGEISRYFTGSGFIAVVGVDAGGNVVV